MEPFFSIVIPCLNEQDYLPRLLTDLQKQKEQNFEVIVADGKSTDHTKERAMSFGTHIPISFFENEKKNVSYQRNFGAKKSKGSYVVFLDADTRVGTSFTDKLKKAIQKYKGLVFIPYTNVDKTDAQTEMVFKFANYMVEFSQSFGKPFSSGGNMIWERNFFLTLGGFNELLYLAEDHAIIQEAHRWGVRPKFLRNVKVVFSLRRLRREGKLAVLYKYIVATGYIFIKGDIKNKIFAYDMGGNVKKNEKEVTSLQQNFKSYFQQLKNFFRDNLT